MKAVITCAGKGSRLFPITLFKPKCMVKINGKPLIDHIISNLIGCSSIDEIIIVDNYKRKMLEHHINKLDCPIRITFVLQKVIDGTSNAVYATKKLINSNFIVLAGDTIYKKEDLERLIHTKNSVLYVDKDEFNEFEYGTLELDGNIIKKIVEKNNPVSNHVNCNGYNFSIDVFDYIEKTVYDKRFNEKIITNTIDIMINAGYRFTGIKIDSLDEVTRRKDIKNLKRKLHGI